MAIKGTVYLLHFDKPIGSKTNARGRAQHYIGWAIDHELRFEKHIAGHGARIVKAAIAQGIKVDIVRTWSDQDRKFERKLKNKKCAPSFCPECRKKIAHPGNFWP